MHQFALQNGLLRPPTTNGNATPPTTAVVRSPTNNTGQSERHLVNRRRRANRMMAAMLCSFILAWLPLNMMNVMRDFDIIDLAATYFYTMFAVVHVIAMTACICNPIIYSWFNEPFRLAVMRMLPEQWHQLCHIDGRMPREHPTASQRPTPTGSRRASMMASRTPTAGAGGAESTTVTARCVSARMHTNGLELSNIRQAYHAKQPKNSPELSAQKTERTVILEAQVYGYNAVQCTEL